MSYEVYQTEGIILGYKDVGEADRILSVFSENFGKIKILAKGTRLLKSKLRYHLDLFGWSRFTFISAKETWRLVDAEQIYFWGSVAFCGNKMNICGKIADLIQRMIRGEEFDGRLWGLIKNSFLFIDEKKDIRNLKDFETVFTLNFLFKLGYVSFDCGFLKPEEKETLIFLANGNEWSENILGEVRANELAMKRIIKNAFEASQL
ncbi:MAG: DNA repair protein RecO [Candidatus Tagabacteria bacterium RIFCSPLOWO2_01_FULL_39_11]|uniref:DNA repair protein RecO n=1 Tax=Candidatus Tagabacteria bacterium RIFCSPLOWO2_01_FULL_39_11 TaxID=1802295 RepID=A0A1G2LQ74_9BACT|nr:MAG: DNA repair protein RecO [Candidatus Tagabacteria bacterium RIFCSPLOWO2_01_FULL_39_11]